MAIILEFKYGNFVDSRYIVDQIIGEVFLRQVEGTFRVLYRKTTECVCKIPMIKKNVVNSSRKAVSKQTYQTTS